MHIPGKLFLVVLVACLTITTEAQTRTQGKDDAWTATNQGTLPRTSSLHIKAKGGSVLIEAVAGTRVKYQVRMVTSPGRALATKGPTHPYNVQTQLRADGAWLVATRSSAFSQRIPAQLVVFVPSGIKSLTLEVNGGEVQIGKIDCQVIVHSGGGNINLADGEASVVAETAAQDITIGSVEGNAWFRTAGGKISVNLVKGNLDAWTGAGTILVNTSGRNALLQAGAGDIRITNCGRELKVASGGGNLVLGDVGGRADLRTNGGNIRLQSARGFVRAQTSGGNIELLSVPAANAQTGVGSISATFSRSAQTLRDSFLRTNAGDISVYLPADLAITVEASIDLGNGRGITSDFPEIHVVSANTVPRAIVAEGTLNGGGPLMKLHVITGNISIQKLPRFQ